MCENCNQDNPNEHRKEARTNSAITLEAGRVTQIAYLNNAVGDTILGLRDGIDIEAPIIALYRMNGPGVKEFFPRALRYSTGLFVQGMVGALNSDLQVWITYETRSGPPKFSRSA